MALLNHLTFTKTNIDALPFPVGSTRVTYHDTHKQASGLKLRVTSTGAMTFCVFRRVQGGSPERITLGRYPDMTIEQARRQAAMINAAIAEGANPAEVKRAHRAERTFGDLFAEYIERHAKLNKLTWAEDDQRYGQYLKVPLGSKKLSSVDRRAIASIHSAISSDGHPTVANRVLALISSVYGWAINAGVCESNPAIGIRRNKETSRDRFLQADELRRFFAALDEELNETVRDYFLMALFTGARRANVLAMHYDNINFERAEWRINKTKNGTPQTVTLSPVAIEILQQRKALLGGGYVFPGTGSSGHLVEPRKGWERLLARAGLSDLRIHDLRRTFGSWQAITGSSLAIIGKSLNHKNVATTAIYARLDSDPVRASVNTATTAMLEAGKINISSSDV